MNLTSENVRKIFLECLFTDDEVSNLVPGEMPEYIIKVRGILSNIGFHPYRLYKRYGDIHSMLMKLPTSFHKSKGLGDSFLNACNNMYNEQWTGMHRIMEELFLLGIGSGIVIIPFPREMWKNFPGGMPIITIKDY